MQATRVLKNADVNITALSLADTTEFGILRLILNDCPKAKKAFADAGYVVSETDVAAIEIPNKPGSLEIILEHLSNAKVNIDYMYAFSLKGYENALMIFRFHEIDKALDALQSANIPIVKNSDISNG